MEKIMMPRDACRKMVAERDAEIAALKAEVERLRAATLSAGLAAECKRLTDDNAALQKQLMDWENREAAVCPENVGFDEHIAALKRQLETLRLSNDRFYAEFSDERDALREQVARLSAPVSDEEIEAIIGKALNPGDVSFQMAARQFADELILARKEGR